MNVISPEVVWITVLENWNWWCILIVEFVAGAEWVLRRWAYRCIIHWCFQFCTRSGFRIASIKAHIVLLSLFCGLCKIISTLVGVRLVTAKSKTLRISPHGSIDGFLRVRHSSVTLIPSSTLVTLYLTRPV